VNVGHGGGFTNVYVNKTVVVNNTVINNNNVSYNGPGGATAKPTPAEQQAAQEHHIAPTPAQTEHVTAAAKNPQLLAKNNGGKPAVAATAKPGDFSPKSAVPAKAAGGKVNPASLKATAKTMPPAPKTAAAGGKNEPPAKTAGKNEPPAKTAPTTGKSEPPAKTPPAAAKNEPPAKTPPAGGKAEPLAKPAPHSTPAPAPKAAEKPAPKPAPTSHPAPAPHTAAPASHPAPAAHPSAPPKSAPPKSAPPKQEPKEKEKH
jgi:hypothetical protein